MIFGVDGFWPRVTTLFVTAAANDPQHDPPCLFLCVEYSLALLSHGSKLITGIATFLSLCDAPLYTIMPCLVPLYAVARRQNHFAKPFLFIGTAPLSVGSLPRKESNHCSRLSLLPWHLIIS
jgi:hypothetical protein